MRHVIILLTMWSLWMWIVTFQAMRLIEYASPLCCCAWMKFYGCDWCIFRSGSLCDLLPHGSPAFVFQSTPTTTDTARSRTKQSLLIVIPNSAHAR